jgi:hypothetical protein
MFQLLLKYTDITTIGVTDNFKCLSNPRLTNSKDAIKDIGDLKKQFAF